MRLYSGLAKLFGQNKCLGIAFAIAVNATGALAEQPTAAGFWQATYDDGKPSGWFYFVEKNGVYEGRLVKGFKKTPDEPIVETCVHCPGDKKNSPMMGLVIVWGMQRNGAKYENGSILDPRNGSVYHAQMEVSHDGQKLFVRGYLGIELFGQTQTWTRLPDNVIATSAIPGEPVVAPQPKKKPPVQVKTSSHSEQPPSSPGKTAPAKQ